MTTKQLPTEGELEELLRDDPAFFMQALFEFYGPKIMAYLGKVSRDVLTEDELEDAFEDTMVAVLERVQQEDFDPERPLRIVFRIARNKGVDYRRRKLGCSEKTNREKLIELYLRDLADSDLALDWKYAAEEEKRRFNEALPEIIAGLPDRQKAAWNAFLECYEEIRPKDKYQRLAEAMGALTGRKESVVAAKSALRAGRDKIRAELKRRGFGFLEGRRI